MTFMPNGNPVADIASSSNAPLVKQLFATGFSWGLFATGFLTNLRDVLQIVAFILAIAVSTTTLVTWFRNNRKRPGG